MDIIEDLTNIQIENKFLNDDLNKNNTEKEDYFYYPSFLSILNHEKTVNDRYNNNIGYNTSLLIKKTLVQFKRKNICSKKELKKCFKNIDYFRINKNVLKELSINDKKELKKLEILNNKNFNYYIMTDYLYSKITKKIENKKVLKNIIYYFIAHKRKRINGNLKKDIKIKRKKNDINDYLKEKKEMNQENIILKNFYKYTKKIEKELNKILKFKINISFKNNTVSIYDKKTNNFLVFDIITKSKLNYNTVGMCNYNVKTIFLASNKNIKEDIIVFFHELGHMYDYFINYIVRENCKEITSLRENFSNIDTENVSMFFEVFAEKELAKYTKEYNYDKKNHITNLVFDYINNKKKQIKINGLMEEIYFYNYYLFRQGYKYSDEEIEKGKDMYVYGYEKAIKLYNSIN